ncbi:hypothetical protein ACJJTC_000842 [Scirpophaga incertulas]
MAIVYNQLPMFVVEITFHDFGSNSQDTNEKATSGQGALNIMAYIIVSSLLLYSTIHIYSFPINNGFTVKFSPVGVKEEPKLKHFGNLFTKIPQKLTTDVKSRREFLFKSYYPSPPEVAGCTNQVAKLLHPTKISNSDEFMPLLGITNSINLPIVKQSFAKYKILVASAPPDFKITGDQSNSELVMYVVFSDEVSEESNDINIPNIYFVKKNNGRLDLADDDITAPVFIVDSNRTTTSIRSKDIEKYVVFRNKLTSRYKYEVS